MIGYCEHSKRVVISEADCWSCIETNAVIFKLTDKNQCEYWRDKEPERNYKCLDCGRKFFESNIIHRCKGALRKRRFHFTEIKKER